MLLLKNSLFYLSATAVSKGMPFLLIPLLTRYLSVEDFGRLAVATAVVSILSGIVGLNPFLFVIARYSQHKQSDFASYVYQLLSLSLISFLIVAIFLSAIPNFLERYGINQVLFFVLASIALGRAVMNMGLAILQMEKNAASYLRYSLLSAILIAVFVFVFVIEARIGWRGMFISEFVAVAVVCFFLVIRLQRTGYIQRDFSSTKLKEVVGFSLPLVPHVIALWVMNSIDRFILAEMVDMKAVGLYSAAYTLGLGVSLLHESFQRAWQPYFFEYLTKNEWLLKARIVRYTWFYYFGSIVLFFIYVWLLSVAMPYLVGEDFMEAFKYIPMIVLGYTFFGMYRAVSGFLYHVNRTGVLASVTVISAVLNVILNYILISRNGVIGAAQATAFTFLFSFIAVKVLAVRCYEMPWFTFYLRTEQGR